MTQILPTPETSGLYDRLRGAAAEIRHGLDFDPQFGLDESPDKGNCYEFAVRTPDYLDDDETKTVVVHAYGHAFNAGTHDRRLYIVSANVPGLIGVEQDEITDSPFFLPDEDDPDSNPLDLLRRSDINGSVACYFNMRSLVRNMRHYPRALEKIEEYNPWYSKRWLMADKPTAAIMDIPFARDALSNYCMLRRGVAHPDIYPDPAARTPDFELTREALERLRLRTPQHETRPRYNNELTYFRKAVRQMAIGRELSADDLCELVHSYEDILPATNCDANTIFGDCMRSIGLNKGSEKALDKARRLYLRALDHARKGNVHHIETKISKAGAQAPRS